MSKKSSTFASAFRKTSTLYGLPLGRKPAKRLRIEELDATLAQLVEQRIRNA